MFRKSELVILVFFVWTGILAVIPGAPPRVRISVPLINAGIVLAVTALAWAERGAPRRTVSALRDWFPLALLLFAYQEMGWFAMPQTRHDLELRWVEWDRTVLRGGLSAVVEALGPVVPALLELSYSLVYSLAPASVALLYANRRRKRVDPFLFTFSLAVLLCYAQFPFWPSEPPRTVFPGEDFPRYETVFRRFNFGLLAGYGIHTSVFPSAHVAGAFSAALGMRLAMPEKRWPWRVLLVMAVLIATATVYGRYHYLADAGAGLALALAAWGAARLTFPEQAP